MSTDTPPLADDPGLQVRDLIDAATGQPKPPGRSILELEAPAGESAGQPS